MGLVNFLFLLIDLNRVCINIIKLAPDVLNSYLLLFIHKFILFALTTHAIIIFIMYLYLYLLKSLYLLEFIMVYVCVEVDCIYSNCISTVIIGLVFIADYICILFIFTHIYGTGSNFLLFNTCAINFIERNFILKEGHVIL